MTAAGRPVQLRVGDFFGMVGERRFDAVIGNPPYVRYQGCTGALRAAGRRAALNGGVGLTALASSWAAFTVHAAEFLRPGGRLGLVLPAELLTVNYAAYGGGILKLEPREADQLPVPSPAVVAACRPELITRRRAVREALRRGDLLGAVGLVDQVLLGGRLGLDAEAHAELVGTHAV